MQLLKEIHDLDAQDQQARVAAAKEYGEIIARAEKPKKDDATRLRDLMKRLDLTADDVTQDANALSDVRRAEGDVLSDKALQKLIDAGEAAVKARMAAEEDFTRQVRELQMKASQALLDRSNAESRSDSAKRTIAQLKKSRPLAFGSLPPAPATEPAQDFSPRVMNLNQSPDFKFERPADEYRIG